MAASIHATVCRIALLSAFWVAPMAAAAQETAQTLAERQAVAESLLRSAEAGRRDGRYAEAERALRAALSMLDGAAHPLAMATARNNLGQVLFDQGRYGDAEPLFRASLQVIEAALGATAGEDRAGQDRAGEDLAAFHTLSLNNLANTLAATGRSDAATSLYRHALSVAQTALGADHPQIALLLNNLGEFERVQGRPSAAELWLRRALEIFEAQGGPDHPGVATALNNLALSLTAMARHREARALYRRAVALRKTALPADHPALFAIYSNLAWSGLLSGAPSAGFEAARAAMAIHHARRDLGEHARADAGVARDAMRADVAAFVAMRSAWEWARAGGGVPPGDTPDALRREAFLVAQTTMRSPAATALGRSSARIAAGDALLSSLVERWEALLRSRHEIDTRLFALAATATGPRPGTYRALVDRRAGIDATLAELQGRLTREYPAFLELVRPGAVDVDALQRQDGPRHPLLEADEALVVLTTGIEHWHGLVFVVTTTGFAWAELAIPARELAESIARLRAGLDRPENGVPGGTPFERTTAHRLYRALFGAPPIAALLADKPHWVLVPQGPLLSLPFAALVTAQPTGSDRSAAALRATPWLGLERSLSVLPSVAGLRFLRGGHRASGPPSAAFFGLGDPDFRATARTGTAGTARAADHFLRGVPGDPEALRQLARLPGTRREILAMAETLGAGPESYLLGAEATETALAEKVLDGALSRAGVVVFATHGLPAGALAGLSEPALALTPPERVRPDDDGLLTASEAARLHLSADWLILSACDTAAGERPGGDGLNGLARAFFYAGARALLVSHWRLRDDAAMRLTTRAIRYWREGAGRAEALRRSMRALMTDPELDGTPLSYAHPSAWAPFMVVGVGR